MRTSLARLRSTPFVRRRPYRSLGHRLRYRISTIEEEDRYLLVSLPAHVHRTVYPVGWCIPVCLAGSNLNPLSPYPIPVLNRQSLPADYDAHALVGVNVPGCCLPGL